MGLVRVRTAILRRKECGSKISFTFTVIECDGRTENKITIRFAVQKGSVDVLMPTDTVQAEVWT